MDRRDILLHLSAIGVASFVARPAAAREQASEDQILASIHPQLRDAARAILGQPQVPLTHATLPSYRAGAASPPLTDVPFERRLVPGRSGQPDVAVYLINSRSGSSRPAILHMHGGGFVTGSAESSVPDLQRLCRELDCVAVSVDYRLAPETTYAGSLEDNYAGLMWLHEKSAQLGVDPSRIALLGESAGGGHAALLAITARDRGEVPVCFQCLVYPMLDDRTGIGADPPSSIGHVIWDRQKNRFGWESFLGRKPGSRFEAGGVPARIANLAGLPAAWIGVGSADLFVDEDIDYAQRLNNAGVQAELLVIPGGYHAFDGAPAEVSRQFTSAKVEALRRALRDRA